MGLDQIRDAARAAIHGQFALPAVVRSPDGLVEIPLTIRLHRNVRKPIGDLDREGFALVIEESNMVIFDREQWNPIGDAGWTVDFGRDRKFDLGVVHDDAGERYPRVQVTYVR
jgi:hypothetical protein